MLSVVEESKDPIAFIIKSKRGQVIGDIEIDPSEEIDDGREVILPNREAWMFPSPIKRQVILVAGRPGSGKSVWIRNFTVLYKEFYPNNSVFLISAKDSDRSLEGMKASWGIIPGKVDIQQINFTPDNIDNLLKDSENTVNKFKDSLVIFDDVIFMDKQFMKKLDNLLEQLINLGRDRMVSVLVSKHKIMDQRNRLIKASCDGFVCFPKFTFKTDIVNYLRQMGMDDQFQKRVINTDDRWVFVKTQYPLFCMSQSEIFLTN